MVTNHHTTVTAFNNLCRNTGMSISRIAFDPVLVLITEVVDGLGDMKNLRLHITTLAYLY